MVKCRPGEREARVKDRVNYRGSGEWERHFRRCRREINSIGQTRRNLRTYPDGRGSYSSLCYSFLEDSYFLLCLQLPQFLVILDHDLQSEFVWISNYRVPRILACPKVISRVSSLSAKTCI